MSRVDIEALERHLAAALGAKYDSDVEEYDEWWCPVSVQEAAQAALHALPAILTELRASRACIEEIRRISGPTRIIVADVLRAYDATGEVPR